MILQFSSVKKLMDFVRATHLTQYELDPTSMTLVATLRDPDLNFAFTCGATVLEGTGQRRPVNV